MRLQELEQIKAVTDRFHIQETQYAQQRLRLKEKLVEDQRKCAEMAYEFDRIKASLIDTYAVMAIHPLY
mgnify:FL=1